MGKEGAVGARSRALGSATMVVVLALGLTACIGGWLTPQARVTLIVGEPVASGGAYEVLISAINLPDGGLAGIQCGELLDEALAFSDVDMSSVVATGLNGFLVTAEDFTTTANEGSLIAVNAATGIEGGAILKLTFQATGADPSVTVDETKVKLSSALDTWIALGQLVYGSDKPYYGR
jgi:hypothetical protein